jgi:Ca-activated chloride channel family protein
MNFDAPHYLPWIFGGIALFWILWLHRRWQSRTAQIWANPRFLKHWRRSHPLWQRYAADLCLCLAIIGIILALARPQWGLQATDMRQRSLDIAVLLDISNSMNLQDIAPSRWQRMVLELEVFLQKLTGDRVALVAFDGEAGLQSPLTDDVAALRELLWHSRPGILPDHGDGLSAAIHQTAKLLKTREDNYARIAVILSDGTSKSDYQRSREAAYALSNQGISLFIIGIGLHNPPPINNMPDTPTQMHNTCQNQYHYPLGNPSPQHNYKISPAPHKDNTGTLTKSASDYRAYTALFKI